MTALQCLGKQPSNLYPAVTKESAITWLKCPWWDVIRLTVSLMALVPFPSIHPVAHFCQCCLSHWTPVLTWRQHGDMLFAW